MAGPLPLITENPASRERQTEARRARTLADQADFALEASRAQAKRDVLVRQAQAEATANYLGQPTSPAVTGAMATSPGYPSAPIAQPPQQVRPGLRQMFAESASGLGVGEAGYPALLEQQQQQQAERDDRAEFRQFIQLLPTNPEAASLLYKQMVGRDTEPQEEVMFSNAAFAKEFAEQAEILMQLYENQPRLLQEAVGELQQRLAKKHWPGGAPEGANMPDLSGYPTPAAVTPSAGGSETAAGRNTLMEQRLYALARERAKTEFPPLQNENLLLGVREVPNPNYAPAVDMYFRAYMQQAGLPVIGVQEEVAPEPTAAPSLPSSVPAGEAPAGVSPPSPEPSLSPAAQQAPGRGRSVGVPSAPAMPAGPAMNAAGRGRAAPQSQAGLLRGQGTADNPYWISEDPADYAAVNPGEYFVDPGDQQVYRKQREQQPAAP